MANRKARRAAAAGAVPAGTIVHGMKPGSKYMSMPGDRQMPLTVCRRLGALLPLEKIMELIGRLGPSKVNPDGTSSHVFRLSPKGGRPVSIDEAALFAEEIALVHDFPNNRMAIGFISEFDELAPDGTRRSAQDEPHKQRFAELIAKNGALHIVYEGKDHMVPALPEADGRDGSVPDMSPYRIACMVRNLLLGRNMFDPMMTLAACANNGWTEISEEALIAHCAAHSIGYDTARGFTIDQPAGSA